jgi:CRISPR-associated protein Cas5h
VALVFDIEGDMALFRKPYTTTSMVSYPFPPPTAVAGMIAAIIGINHEASQNAKNARYWDKMTGVQIGIALQSPLRWINTAVNLMKLKTLNEKMTEPAQITVLLPRHFGQPGL